MINFFHYLLVAYYSRDGEKLCQYDDKEIRHGLHLINNGASIQVELGLFIVEIYVDQHSKC